MVKIAAKVTTLAKKWPRRRFSLGLCWLLSAFTVGTVTAGTPSERTNGEIGIDPHETTLLMMAGGLGIGELPDLAGRLLSLERSFRIVALAGKNERLKSDLERLARDHGDRLLPVGFTTTIERFMAASDLAVSKPGGLTTSECLAVGLPMIVVSPIPGQEERNADFLLENGAALKAHDAAGLEFRVSELLDHPERLRGMRQAARRIARLRAAEDVLSIVLGHQG